MSHRLFAALGMMADALAASPGTARPAEQLPDVPVAAYLQAFNDTCRRGFPDLDAIARNAAAQGWIERTLRLAGGGTDPLAARLPRAFAKGRLMLFLTRLPDGPVAASCQVTSNDESHASAADVAAIVSPSLNAAVPVPVRDQNRDMLRWTVAAGMTVDAGIAIHGRMRTVSITVSKTR